MTTLLTIIAAVVIFAVLIFIHEFGHFITAKLSNIKVYEFALGMGPKIFSFEKGETKYSLRLFPIGGYCMLEGEDGESDDERALVNKSPLIRLLVLASGAFMNILLGFLLLIIVNSFSPSYVSTQIEYVEAESAAQESGIMPGDRVKEINKKNTPTFNFLSWDLADTIEKTDFTIERNGEKKVISVTPEFVDGVYKYGIKFKAEKNGFFPVLKNSFFDTVFYSKVIVESLFDLLRGKVGVDQLSGPIGIVNEIGNAVNVASTSDGVVGIRQLLMLAVLLTVNLGVFNLIPIPALDGGRILFVLIEIIRRKPLAPEKEGLVHAIGFAALIVLSLFVAYMDILKIF